MVDSDTSITISGSIEKQMIIAVLQKLIDAILNHRLPKQRLTKIEWHDFHDFKLLS